MTAFAIRVPMSFYELPGAIRLTNLSYYGVDFVCDLSNDTNFSKYNVKY